MSGLTRAQREFWDEQGYVVIPDAVPPALLDAVVDAIWMFLQMDRNRPDEWYRHSSDSGLPHVAQRRTGGVVGLVDLFHDQALWDVRQHPKIYDIFVDIFRQRALWVKFDRASMNPPVRPGWDPRTTFHWDMDTTLRPVPLLVQGVLYLTDTAADQGALRVIPGFHRMLPSWVATQPAHRDLKSPDTTGLSPVTIAGRAGDLVLWHSALPHTNSRNTTDRPRLAQYITMLPAREGDEAACQSRIDTWRERRAPGDISRGRHPTEIDPGAPAELTALGRKLVGLDRWT